MVEALLIRESPNECAQNSCRTSALFSAYSAVNYSSRSAVSGLTRDARWAGTHAAIRAIAVSASGTMVKVRRSCESTP